MLDKPETKLEWTLAFVHAATALRPEECFAQWPDIDYQKNQILVRRTWSKGKETAGKTKRVYEARRDATRACRVFEGMAKRVSLRPGLRFGLRFLSREGKYSPGGIALRTGLSAPSCRTGVIAKEDPSRFGWHNLRHSLATFFASNEVHPSVIRASLRHAKPQTTARFIHAVNTRQVEAQGKFLEAIKKLVQETQIRRHKSISGWPSDWELTAGANLFP